MIQTSHFYSDLIKKLCLNKNLYNYLMNFVKYLFKTPSVKTKLIFFFQRISEGHFLGQNFLNMIQLMRPKRNYNILEI